MIGGIYRIRNILDQKFYIGSTKNIDKRGNIHFNQLRRNKHDNRFLQFAWNKYGEHNFIYEHLECFDNPTAQELFDWEDWYLKNTPCLSHELGYNLSNSASRANLGIKRSDAHKKMISKKHRGIQLGKGCGNFSSKFLGVHFNKARNRWRVKIRKHYKETYIGDYKTEIEAALAFNNAVIAIYGDKAVLNEVC